MADLNVLAKPAVAAPVVKPAGAPDAQPIANDKNQPAAGGPQGDQANLPQAGQRAAVGLDDKAPAAPEDLTKQLVQIMGEMVKLLTQMTEMLTKLLPGAAGKGGPGATPLPLGELPKDPQAAGTEPAPTEPAKNTTPIEGSRPGGWLVNHGQYKKEGDGSYSITGGPLAGSKAIPEGGGKYNIIGADGKAQGQFQAPGGKDKIASPLTFDLNGNGKVGTTSAADGKAFDIDGDGKVDQTAWAEKGDGVLAFDRDGDGVAGADGKELLGNNTDIGDGKQHANGFEALKGLARKHLGAEAVADGKLDAAELAALEKKAGLTMKVDGQNKSLKDLGITEMNLGYSEKGANADANGNEHRQVGAGFTRNGQAGAVNDVWFKYN